MDDIVTRLREHADEEKQVGNDLLRDVLCEAADEIERLRALVRELRPYMEVDMRSGLEMGGPTTEDPEYREHCPDCAWHNDSLVWAKRIESGELDV